MSSCGFFSTQLIKRCSPSTWSDLFSPCDTAPQSFGTLIVRSKLNSSASLKIGYHAVDRARKTPSAEINPGVLLCVSSSAWWIFPWYFNCTVDNRSGSLSSYCTRGTSACSANFLNGGNVTACFWILACGESTCKSLCNKNLTTPWSITVLGNAISLVTSSVDCSGLSIRLIV